MVRALKVCSVPQCPELCESGRCDAHRREASMARGGYAERGGGGSNAWRGARAACLLRDPICVCTNTEHGHGDRCYAPSNVADHYPDSKRDLVAMGVADVDALHRLRGVCTSCHNRHTAVTAPGGWNAR